MQTMARNKYEQQYEDLKIEITARTRHELNKHNQSFKICTDWKIAH